MHRGIPKDISLFNKKRGCNARKCPKENAFSSAAGAITNMFTKDWPAISSYGAKYEGCPHIYSTNETKTEYVYIKLNEI